MRLGFFSDSLPGLTQSQVLDFATREGLNWLELGCGNWSQAPHVNVYALLRSSKKRKEFLSQLEKRGLRIAALNCSGNQLAPGETGRRHDRVVRATLRLAGTLGVNRVVMMSGCPGGPGDRNPNWIITDWPTETRGVLKWQWDEVALPYWQRLSRLAEQEGVQEICIELHGTQLVYNTSTFLYLHQSIGKVIRCNLDPTHLFWMGGDPISVARRIGDLVGFVHAKDFAVYEDIAGPDTLLETRPEESPQDRAWNFVTVGRGHDASWWRQFLGVLKGKGYAGVLSIEQEDRCIDAMDGIREAHRFLLEIVEAVESASLDAKDRFLSRPSTYIRE